jgi:hypothetical protein
MKIKINILIAFLLIGCNSANNEKLKTQTLGEWSLNVPGNAEIQRNSDSSEMQIQISGKIFLRAYIGASEPKEMDSTGQLIHSDTIGTTIIKSEIISDEKQKNYFYLHAWDTLKCTDMFFNVNRCEGIEIEGLNIPEDSKETVKTIFKSVKKIE